MKNRIDIIIASDELYAKYATICIKSLLDTNFHYQIIVHLLNNGISEQSVKIIEQTLRSEDELHLYPIQDITSRLGTKISMEAIPISITTYGRLFVSSILPPSVLKALYVDCDIIFNDDISPFYDSDLGDCLVGGVLDTFMSCRAKQSIGIEKYEAYVNAGVLLIPLGRWRVENIEKSFMDFLHLNNGNVYHHDQGVINAVCARRKKIFLPKYNASSYYFSHPYRLLRKYNTPFYTKQECREAVKHPAIIHFTSGVVNRPWVEYCVHPLAWIFNKYKKQTAYRDIPLIRDNRTLIERVDSWLFLNIPYILYRMYYSIRTFQYKLKQLLKLIL